MVFAIFTTFKTVSNAPKTVDAKVNASNIPVRNDAIWLLDQQYYFVFQLFVEVLKQGDINHQMKPLL